MNQQKKELGALWERQSKKGMTFLSGVVEFNGKKIEVIAFRENNKKNEKQPDWRIYLGEQKTSVVVQPVSQPDVIEDVPF